MNEVEQQSENWGSAQPVETEGDNRQIEALRLILSFEQSRDVSYEEAVEIGESLVTFYEALAGAV